MDLTLLDDKVIMFAVLAVALWQLPWKGIALWRAARSNDRTWFIILLIVQTAGILDILYIFLIHKNRKEKLEKSIPTNI